MTFEKSISTKALFPMNSCGCKQNDSTNSQANYGSYVSNQRTNSGSCTLPKRS